VKPNICNRLKRLICDIRGNIKIEHVVIIWLAVNIISACSTQLYTDESYYVLYANRLAFGYFDHPPMLALMIRTGSFFLKNEIGVRLLSVISVTLALYIIYKLADVHKPVLFFAAIFSIFGLNHMGFLALPDSPLLLFSVLFFLLYKKFLLKESYFNSILLGLIMAALLYSKYHGILIILFTIISNLKLLRSGKFRLAVAVAFILLIPHIIWQLNNNLITISYHLFERNASHYRLSFTLGYLTGQVLYYGPVSLIFMFIAAIKFKRSDLFEKALLWNLWGFFAFFLLSSLKGRVEANWTYPVIIPLLIFFLKFNDAKPFFFRWFYFLSVPVIIMICIYRLEIAYPFLGLKINRIDDYRENKEFVKEVVAKSQGLPIIANSYQRAGLVSFYANTFTPSINVNGRRNQFDLWHDDDSLRFKKVAFVNNYLDEGNKIGIPKYESYKVTVIDSLPAMNDIIITTGLRRIKVKQNDEVSIKVILLSQHKPENYRDAGHYETRLLAGLYKGDKLIKEEVCALPLDLIMSKYNGEYDFQFLSPAKRGNYQILISLKTSLLGLWSTKKSINLIVR
jgi:hypothetical protein